ncbi:dockerin type I domain-containing protein [Patescibacteria group bacterium]|nr:dockerin type I domain-containing protein [Patescibacteria group bacterium]
MGLFKKSLYRLGDFFSSSKYASIITIAIVIAAIPMTIFVSQQREQVNKQLSSEMYKAVLGAGSVMESKALGCTPGKGQISIFLNKDFDKNIDQSLDVGCRTLGAGDYAYPSEMKLDLYYYDSFGGVYRPYTDTRKKSVNDAISSIKFGSSVLKVIIYKDANYKGGSKEYTGSVSNLSNDGWDNKISSLKVVEAPNETTPQDRLCTGGYIVSRCTDCSTSFDCKQYNNAWSCCPKSAGTTTTRPSSGGTSTSYTNQASCNNACRPKGGECVYQDSLWQCPCQQGGSCDKCLNYGSDGGVCKLSPSSCSGTWVSSQCPGSSSIWPGSNYKCCTNSPQTSGTTQPSGGGSSPTSPSAPSTTRPPATGGATGQLHYCPKPDRCSDTYINCRPLWYSTDPACSDTWNSTKTYSVDCMCQNDPVGKQATKDCRDAPGGKDTSYCSLIGGGTTTTTTTPGGTSPGGGNFSCKGQIGNIIYSCLTSCPSPSWQQLSTNQGICSSGETCCYFDLTNPGGGGGASPITPVPGGPGGGSGGPGGGGGYNPLPTDSPPTNQPTPACNSGAQTGPCVSDNNTCGSSNGTRTITYTSHNSGAQCSQFTTYNNVCGILNCDFGKKCENNQCVPDNQQPTLNPSITPGGQTPPSSEAATLNIVVGLDGIGAAGDNQNPTSGGNKNPKTTVKKAKITAINLNTSTQIDANVDVTYESSSGMFKTETKLERGLYLIKIKVEGYLRKILSINLNINASKIDAPVVNLTTGDINDDNVLSILDYNILISCSTYSRDNKKLCSSSPNFMLFSDLNSDGKVDEVDFNLFTREYSVQTGD